LKRALELRPTHVEAHLTLGQVYMRQRRYAEAQAVLQRAIDLRPDYTQAHYQLFLAYSRTGQPELAEKQLAIFKALEEEDKRERELRERRQQAEKP
jgi:cytochrome c-type biogenesis protein CcmH/NrfG